MKKIHPMEMPLPPGYENNVKLPSPTELPREEVIDILRRNMKGHHYVDSQVLGFVKNFLICRNIKQSAEAVHLSTTEGLNLMREPDIYGAIREVTEKAVLKYGYDAEEVVERVKEIMNLDIVDMTHADGSFITNIRELPPETRRVIKKFKAKNLYEEDPNGMKQFVGQLIEVEFWDKLKAIELLGREKQIFKETRKVEHDITKNMSDTLLESKRRADKRAESIRDVTPSSEEDP